MMYRCLVCLAFITLTLSSTHALDDVDTSISDAISISNNTDIVNENVNGLVNVTTIDQSNSTFVTNMTDVNMTSIPILTSPTSSSPPTIDPSTLRASLLTTDPEIIVKPSPELDVALFVDPPYNPEVDGGDEIETTQKPVKKKDKNKNKSQPTATAPPITSNQDEKSGPIFAGFQGQSFIFHGLADEIFNLISTSSFQLNAHLTYIANGDCTYNETQCFTNPGTYMDQLGFRFGSNLTIKFIAGSHDTGLTVEVMNNRIKPGQYPKGLRLAYTNSADDIVMIRYDRYNRVAITTSQMQFVVMNSDGFMNIQVSLLDGSLLQLGARPFILSNAERCAPMTSVTLDEDTPTTAIQSSSREWMEKSLEQIYGKNSMHGLIGQTWRAATICGRPWMGTTSDYICSSLFATDYVYRLYHSTSSQPAMDDVQMTMS